EGGRCGMTTTPPSTPGELRACPWCAEQIQPAAKVCRYCGRDVEPIASTPAAAAAVPESTAAVPPAPVAPATPPPGAQTKLSTPMLLGLALAAVVVLAGIGLLIGQALHTDKPTPIAGGGTPETGTPRTGTPGTGTPG